MAIGMDVNTQVIFFRVTLEDKQDIKKRAKEQGISMRQYIYESLILRKDLEDKKKVRFIPRD